MSRNIGDYRPSSVLKPNIAECIFCCEEYDKNKEHMLSCGHIFHGVCLSIYLEEELVTKQQVEVSCSNCCSEGKDNHLISEADINKLVPELAKKRMEVNLKLAM